MRTDELLKQATAQQKTGDHDAAIESLRQAYREIARDSIQYPVATFLRLPLYLDKAGRREEAWAEFERLLREGYPHQHPDGKTMDAALIYDKMRLTAQREKRHDAAIDYGIRAYRAELEAQPKSVQKQMKTKKYIAAVVEPLLKKAKRLEELDRFVEELL